VRAMAFRPPPPHTHTHTHHDHHFIDVPRARNFSSAYASTSVLSHSPTHFALDCLQSGDSLPSPLQQPDSPLSGFSSTGVIPGLGGAGEGRGSSDAAAAAAAAAHDMDVEAGGGAADDDNVGEGGAQTPPGEPPSDMGREALSSSLAAEERPTKKIRI
jgi:hypothetical protein